MKLYDISQEVFGCAVYPGDPAPQKECLASILQGSAYNLTAFSMCAHNGTHIDAPFHFLNEGKTVEQLALSQMVGLAFVAEHKGSITADDIKTILETAKNANPEAAKRLLIKGPATLTSEAATILAQAGIVLFGNESQTVGPEDAPMAVHRILLGAEIVLLEGIRLQKVPNGVYVLNAAPLALAGTEGAPCRAILIYTLSSSS